MAKFKKILILIFMKLLLIHKSVHNIAKINFIYMVLANNSRPFNIFHCWDKDILLQFSNKQMEKFHFLSILHNIEDSKFYENEVFLLDTNCDGYKSILQKADKLRLFTERYSWLIFNNGSINLNEFNFLFNSNVYTIDTNLSMNNIFKIRSENAIIEENVDNYKIERKTRKNVMNHLLNVSIVITNNKSLSHLTDYREKHIDSITKANYQLVNFVLDYLNASRNFKIVDTWGYRVNNSSYYTGMLGQIQRNEAEIGGSSLFFTVDRISYIDYIAMLTPTTALFLFRQPPLSYVDNLFFLPFSINVWYCTIALVLLTIISLYMVLHIGPKIKSQTKSGASSFSDIIMLTVGAISQQGLGIKDFNTAAKIVTITVFLSMMFIYTAYSANIVAILQSTAKTITTLDDLLNSKALLAAEDNPYNQYYFKKIAPVGEKEHFTTVDEGIEKVRNNFFAFHVEEGVGYKIISETYQEHEKCGLAGIHFLQVSYPWLSIKKNSTFNEIIKIGFRKVQENGLQNREFLRTYTKKPQCNNQGSNFVSVSLGDIYGAFYLFGTGCGLSIAAFLYEKFSKSYQKRIHPSSSETVQISD